jgi:hypothetical protein
LLCADAAERRKHPDKMAVMDQTMLQRIDIGTTFTR